MEPTIMEDDGYLLVPAGTIESGDILTYYSAERNEYATHRVVEVTDEGFVTQGDNNPSTDQSGGDPLVTEDDVLGKVATVGDRPVVLPQFGVAMTAIRTHWKLGLGALVILFGVSGNATRARNVVRFRSFIVPLVVMGIIGMSVALLLPPSASVTFVATDTPESGEMTIPVGSPATRTIEPDISAQPDYTHQFVETTGMELTAIELSDRADRLHVRVPAQAEPGPYQAEIRVYRYPAVLPYGVVAPLQSVHPAVAAVATMSTIIGPLYLLVWLFVDGKEILEMRSRRRPLGELFR